MTRGRRRHVLMLMRFPLIVTVLVFEVLICVAVFAESPSSGMVNYSYDAMGRLTKATYPSGQSIVYGYDSANNLVYAAEGNAAPWTWISGNSAGNWSDAANWSGGLIPDNGLDAFLPGTGGSTTVVDSVSRALWTLNFSGYSAVIASGGASLTISNGISVASNTLVTVAAPVNMGGNPNRWAVASNAVLNVSGVIGGANPIIKSGDGTLILSGSNIFTGGITIADGVVSVSSNANLGAASAPLTFAGGILQVTGTALSNLNSRTVNWTTFAGGLDIVEASNTFKITSAISGAGAMIKNGAGTLILTGSNTFTGGTIINDGSLQTDGNWSLGAGGVINNSFLVFNRSGTSIVNNVISGSGSIVTKGSGTLILTASNMYGGVTTINSGTLQLNGNGSFGSGAVINNSVLAFNPSGTCTVNNAISGSGSVVLNGVGWLILTASNSYSGGTIVNKGTIIPSDSSAFGTGTLVIASGSVLDINGQNLQNTAIIVCGSGIGGTGSVINTGPQQLNALKNVVLSGDTTVGGSRRWDVSGTGSLIDLAGYTLTKTANNYIAIRSTWVTDGNLNLLAGILSFEGPAICTGTVGSITVNGGTLSFRGTSLKVDRPIIYCKGVIQAPITSILDSPVSLRTNATILTGSGNLTMNGAISETNGVFGIIKTGTNTLILTGFNTYSGPTIISDGTVQVGNGGLSGTLGSGPIENDGALAFDFTDALTVGNIINGTGTVTKSGSGTLVLTGSNSYTGNTYLLDGVLNAEWGEGLPVTGNLVISGGVWATASGMVSNWGTGPSQFQLLSSTGGFSAVNTPLIVNLGGNAAPLALGDSSFPLSALVLNDSCAAANLTFQNSLDLNGGARTIIVDSTNAVAIITGNISNSGLSGGLIKTGAGTLVFSNNIVTLVGLTNSQGVVIFHDAALTNTVNYIVIGDISGSDATLIFQGSTTVANAGQLVVGRFAGSRGMLVMTNDASYIGSNWIQVGMGGTGVFHMASGTMTITSNGLLAGNGSVGVGAIYHTGGDISAKGEVDVGFQAAGVYGFYQMTGGSLSNGNWIQAGRYGMGLIYQYNGAIINTFNGLMVANGAGLAGTGVFYQAGGVLSAPAVRMVNNATNLVPLANRGELNLAGGRFTVNGIVYMNYDVGANIVNLLGGTAEVRQVVRNKNGGLTIFNFNGGVLCANSNNVVLMGGGAGGLLDGAYVYSGGAIIDTYTNSVTISQPLLTPPGNGVASIDFSAGSLAGYIGAPYVGISGGNGTGATAVALFDYASGSVTGIIITRSLSKNSLVSFE